MSSTTRISDLPESSHYIAPPPLHNGGGGGGGMPNTYAPINLHPNPYGNAPPTDTMPQPQPQYISKSANEDNNESYGKQRLPSRDIPHNTQDYTHDPNINVNYIPPPPSTQNDYIREYEERREPTLKVQEKHKKRVRFADDWLTQLQTPILVMFMYFLFQLSILNKTLYRILGKTSIYNGDGALNWLGVLLKSCLFGVMYYFVIMAMEQISNI